MIVRVLFFGRLTDSLSAEPWSLELADGAAVADLVDALDRRQPGAGGLLQRCMVAVNQEYAHTARPLREGDEVAFLPPVSGG